jgi:hypothetical protein
MLSVVMLIVVMPIVIMVIVVMLSVVMLSVVMVTVIMLSVVILGVLAPARYLEQKKIEIIFSVSFLIKICHQKKIGAGSFCQLDIFPNYTKAFSVRRKGAKPCKR